MFPLSVPGFEISGALRRTSLVRSYLSERLTYAHLI
jgi:hypothetical protein